MNDDKMINKNEKYIKEFTDWLSNQKLTKKTIEKHVKNIYLFLDDYLIYYEEANMEDGITYVTDFFDWFIEKCTWASPASIKETASSIKKFYACMSESNKISVKNYKLLCDEIKEFMPNWISYIEEYNSYEDDEEFNKFMYDIIFGDDK